MADECVRSPRAQQPCILEYTLEAHRAGHQSDMYESYPGFQSRAFWPLTPEERSTIPESS